jgi:hypothetical protein
MLRCAMFFSAQPADGSSLDFEPRLFPYPGTMAVVARGLERSNFNCSVLGAMPTLAVGMFFRHSSRRMATPAWPWHPLHLYGTRSGQ